MIKALRRAGRRSASEDWLLVRPDETGPWHWQRWQAGAVSDQGDWPPPAGWHTLRCAFIVPADAASYFEITAPPGVRPAEWPLLLEDRLLQPPEAVRVGCAGRRGKLLRLVALERTRLANWQQQAVAMGLHVERYWSEFQLCPEVEPGEALEWHVSGYVCRVEADEQGAQRWLALPDAFAGTLGAQVFDGAGPVRLLNSPGHGCALDKLPTLIEARRPRRVSTAGGWHQHRRLAAVCLGLALAWASLMAGKTWQEGSHVQAALAAQLGGASTLQQAERRLRRAQRDEQQWLFRQQQVAALGQTVSGWLAEHPGWALQALGFDGRHWHVTVSGHGDALVDSERWEALGREIGGIVTLTHENGSLTARVDLEGDGA